MLTEKIKVIKYEPCFKKDKYSRMARFDRLGGIIMMKMLAKPINQAFVIAPDKVEEFMSQKTDPAIKARIIRNAERFRKQSKDRKED